MALKRKLNSAEFEALNEVLKAEYKKQDDGLYVLDTDEATELLNALKRERDENKQNKEYVATLDGRIKTLQDEIAAKNGDVDALNKSWKEKMDAALAKREAEVAPILNVAKEGYLKTILGKTVKKFDLPEHYIMGDFAKRVQVEFKDGKPTHTVLDADGNVSALTIADLEKEFFEKEEYSKYIIQSSASGSAGSSGKPDRSGGKPKKLSEMSPEEQDAYIKEKHKLED